jgi:hypothetical protein
MGVFLSRVCDEPCRGKQRFIAISVAATGGREGRNELVERTKLAAPHGGAGGWVIWPSAKVSPAPEPEQARGPPVRMDHRPLAPVLEQAWVLEQVRPREPGLAPELVGEARRERQTDRPPVLPAREVASNWAAGLGAGSLGRQTDRPPAPAAQWPVLEQPQAEAEGAPPPRLERVRGPPALVRRMDRPELLARRGAVRQAAAQALLARQRDRPTGQGRGALAALPMAPRREAVQREREAQKDRRREASPASESASEPASVQSPARAKAPAARLPGG